MSAGQSRTLRSGFGLDLQSCDGEVFAALQELLEEQERERRREELLARYKETVG